MAAVERGAHELEARLELRAAPVVVLVGEARIAADLAQLGELGQHLQFLAPELRGRLVRDLEREPLLACAVQPLLLAGHVRHDDALALLGQVRQHVRLQAPQDERPRDAPQARGGALLPRLHRALVALGEGVPAAQQAGHQEIEDAPQVREAVLHGRAGEREAGGCRQQLRRAGRLRARVLDVLRLVEHHAPQVLAAEVLDVALHEVVRGDEHVGLRAARYGGGARGRRARERDSAQRRGEAPELGHPVVHERRGAHHQRGPLLPRLAAREDMRDHLQRLAQAHVVGEDAAAPHALERAEPAEAVELVGAQVCPERRGRGEIGLGQGVERGDEVAEALVAPVGGHLHPVEEGVDEHRARQRQAVHALDQVGGAHAERLAQGLRLARGVVDAHDLAVGEPDEALAAAIRRQVRDELVRLHPARPELDVEQAAAHGRADGELRCRTGDRAAQPLAQQHLAQGAQLAQPLREQAVEALVVVPGELRLRVAVGEELLDHLRRAALGDVVALLALRRQHRARRGRAAGGKRRGRGRTDGRRPGGSSVHGARIALGEEVVDTLAVGDLRAAHDVPVVLRHGEGEPRARDLALELRGHLELEDAAQLGHEDAGEVRGACRGDVQRGARLPQRAEALERPGTTGIDAAGKPRAQHICGRGGPDHVEGIELQIETVLYGGDAGGRGGRALDDLELRLHAAGSGARGLVADARALKGIEHGAELGRRERDRADGSVRRRERLTGRAGRGALEGGKDLEQRGGMALERRGNVHDRELGPVPERRADAPCLEHGGKVAHEVGRLPTHGAQPDSPGLGRRGAEPRTTPHRHLEGNRRHRRRRRARRMRGLPSRRYAVDTSALHGIEELHDGGARGPRCGPTPDTGRRLDGTLRAIVGRHGGIWIDKPLARQVAEGKRDGVLAHSVVAMGRRAGACVVDHLGIGEVELDARAVACPLRTLHKPAHARHAARRARVRLAGQHAAGTGDLAGAASLAGRRRHAGAHFPPRRLRRSARRPPYSDLRPGSTILCTSIGLGTQTGCFYFIRAHESGTKRRRVGI